MGCYKHEGEANAMRATVSSWLTFWMCDRRESGTIRLTHKCDRCSRSVRTDREEMASAC